MHKTLVKKISKLRETTQQNLSLRTITIQPTFCTLPNANSLSANNFQYLSEFSSNSSCILHNSSSTSFFFRVPFTFSSSFYSNHFFSFYFSVFIIFKILNIYPICPISSLMASKICLTLYFFLYSW